MMNSISSENILWNKGEMKTFSQTRTKRVAAGKPVTKKNDQRKFYKQKW